MKAVNWPGLLYASAALRSIVPGGAIGRRARQSMRAPAGNVPFEKLSITSIATFTASCPPFWIMSYQRLPVGSARYVGIAREQLREEAHVVGVVGHHDEVERARELPRMPFDAVTSSPRAKRYASAGPSARAEGAGVHRGAGVHMGVAEERTCREVASGVGRVALLGEGARQRVRRRVGLLGKGGKAQDRSDQTRDGFRRQPGTVHAITPKLEASGQDAARNHTPAPRGGIKS